MKHFYAPFSTMRCLGTALALSIPIAFMPVIPAEADFLDAVRGLITGTSGQGATGRNRGGAIRDRYCTFQASTDNDQTSTDSEIDDTPRIIALVPTTTQKTISTTPKLYLYFPASDDFPLTNAAPPAPGEINSPDRLSTTERAVKGADNRPERVGLLPEPEPPEQSEQTEQAEMRLRFLLEDPNRSNELAAAYFSMPEQPGLVELDFPDSFTLEAGQTYTWSVTLLCYANGDAETVSGSTDQEVYGYIQRVAKSTDLDTALNNSDPDTAFQAYLDHDIWFDMVAALAGNPDSQEWTTLLSEFDLTDIDDPVPQTLAPLAE